MKRPGLASALSTLIACMILSGCAAEASGEKTIEIRFSRFSPEVLTVDAGAPMTFNLRNHDPIGHEWIIGSEEVHERHRTGTEEVHDQRPSEVTIPAYSTRQTTLTFETPGKYAFICHLPGHEQYGMRGVVRVK